jgi:ribosomal protein L12E/L44/L45/RPP1/RPP2
VSYAAFVLSAQGAAITADSVNAVLAAAKVKANANLVSAVVKALSGRNINEFFGSVSGGSSAPAPAAEKPAK